MTSSTKSIPVIVENSAAVAAGGAAVSVGIPLPKGELENCSVLSLTDAQGLPAALQTACLSRWPDGSCRWVLLDFQASVDAASNATFALSSGGANPAPSKAAAVSTGSSGFTLSNGLISLAVETGSVGAVLTTADQQGATRIISLVEIAGKSGPITSEAVIDSFDVYADGPVRAAVTMYGRRVYSDGTEGPFSQRVEIFAGSPYVRIEDTFTYSHLPGTHAEPANALALWKVRADQCNCPRRLDVVSLVADEESNGLVVSATEVAFWGIDEHLDLSRYDDNINIGEDCPGLATGLAKSYAILVGLLPPEALGEKASLPAPARDVWAHTTPQVYADSGALGDFAAANGKFADIEEGMRQIMDFWMWFQDNDPDGAFGRGKWHGLIDWGDWQSRYADRDHNPTGWNYHEGRYGWDCNEMDTTLGLWSAYLHTGREKYYKAAVAMSRHTMDIDTIHVDYRNLDVPKHVYDQHYYSVPWQEGERIRGLTTVGQGRRHNVQHWGNGIGDIRHTWNGGVVMYYYMTGNRRAYDVALEMAEMHLQRISAEAGGEYAVSLWVLYYAWQMTSDNKYLHEFKYRLDTVDKLLLPDGSLPPHVDFREAAAYPDVDGDHGVYLDLALDYFTNALIEYFADTGDPTAEKVLLGLAERNLRDTPDGPADYRRTDALRLLAWAYRRTGRRDFLKRVEYHLSSLSAGPLTKTPSTPDQWRDAVMDLLAPHDWDIRVVGPVMRMAPFAMSAITADLAKGNAQ